MLLDYVDIIVHVQHAEERIYYSLERLWKDCPVIELPDDAVADRRAASGRRASGVLSVRRRAAAVVLWRHGQTAWNAGGPLPGPARRRARRRRPGARPSGRPALLASLAPAVDRVLATWRGPATPPGARPRVVGLEVQTDAAAARDLRRRAGRA